MAGAFSGLLAFAIEKMDGIAGTFCSLPLHLHLHPLTVHRPWRLALDLHPGRHIHRRYRFVLALDSPRLPRNSEFPDSR